MFINQKIKIYFFCLIMILGGFQHLVEAVHVYDEKHNPITIQLLSSDKVFQENTPSSFFLRINIKERWHMYAPGDIDSGPASRIEWIVPEGFTVHNTQWPKAKEFEVNGLTGKGYEGRIGLSTVITPGKNVQAGDEALIKVRLHWVACDDICMFQVAQAELTLPVIKAHGTNRRTITQESVEGEGDTLSKTFFALLCIAFAGGMLLNIMPCVLPVVSLKVLHLVQLSGGKKSSIVWHSAFFSLGIIIAFWALALVLIIFQGYGRQLGWGFQLQEPMFVAALAFIFTLFSLSLFGVFDFAGGIGSLASFEKRKPGVWSAISNGILATLLSTPCTGPLLGTVLGLAAVLAPLKAFLLFTAIALGMAAPYLLLAIFPAFLRFMPKPGSWMITFKELMGFLLLATVFWLAWVFVSQVGVSSLFTLFLGLFLTSIASWVYGRWGGLNRSMCRRGIARLITFIMLLLAAWTVYQAAKPTDEIRSNSWEKFNPDELDDYRHQGIPVFLDFTAKWCLICQPNDTLLNKQGIIDMFEAKGVVRMKADWTKKDPVITKYLRKFVRNGVPLYVLYEEDGKTFWILPQILTKDVIVEYLDKINSEEK